MARDTKGEIVRFLRSHSGRLVIQKSATGAVVFNPSDYCPYSDSCLSFRRHARGKSGCKGVISHLRKIHSDVTYYIVPCSLKEFVQYDKEHPEVVANVLHGLKHGRLNLCPIVSSFTEATSMEKKLRYIFAERRYKDHFDIFLHPSIPLTSRNINRVDIQTHLDALRSGWVRSSASESAVCGRADAMRARMHAIATLANACKEGKSLETIASEVPGLLK